jgi:hypothetical protein
MDPENSQPIKPEEEQKPQGPAVHTYQDDLAKAMNVSDAHVVQELIKDARERETIMEEEKTKERERGWYVFGGIVLLLLSLLAAGYGFYHYRKLTVPVQQSLSVGVFPSTAPIAINTTDVRKTISSLLTDTTFETDKPTLVQFVTDSDSLLPLSKNEFFSFIESTPSEPFVTSIDAIRLGIVHIENKNVPFIITAIPDPETASKEFLIAEPDLLRIFYRALNIDLAAHVSEIGKGFQNEYLYNLPVRTLPGKEGETTLLYGYATDHTIVLTTEPLALKAVYEQLIRQQ